jgi:hypothetical protein
MIAAPAIGALASAAFSATPISSLHRSGSSRVTIRGSGNAISVDRTGSPEEFLDAEEPASTVLDEAIGMKESGTADDALVGYLKAHRAELPALIDFDTLSALRRAGAGRNVVTYLSSVAAVEVGPTGAEGGAREEAEPAYPPEAAMSNELPADLAWGGWGWGWGGNVNGGRRPHVGHHGGAKHDLGRPGSRSRAAPMAMRAAPPRPVNTPSVRGRFAPR